MQTAPAGFFTPQINGMDPSTKYPFFPTDFQGKVRVKACKGITRRNGERAFIAELEVMTSNTQLVMIGGTYSWFQSLKEPGTAYPACIAFLYACLGLDPSNPAHKVKIDAEVKPAQDRYLNMAINEDPKLGKTNALGGAVLMLQTSTKKLKDKTTDFTLHTFTPAPPDAPPVAPKAA